MKSTYVVVFFAIVGITSTNLCTMDFLNDPFFKQLASELDSMFGTGPSADDASLPPYTPKNLAPPLGEDFKTTNNPLSYSKNANPIMPPLVADAAKDLKTLFLESLEIPKDSATPLASPAQKQTKIVVSKERAKAYNFYMGELVKKTRLLERVVASNPARTFGYRFLVSFDEIVDSVDKIEAVHQLILSKKMYQRNFFGHPMQKIREQIVALIPKLDATLRTLRQLLNKEETLDEDIARMQREAALPQKRAALPIKKKDLSKKGLNASGKIGRALQEPKKFGWPKSKSKLPASPNKPAQKKPSELLSPGGPQKTEPLPWDFSLKKIMHNRGVL